MDQISGLHDWHELMVSELRRLEGGQGWLDRRGYEWTTRVLCGRRPSTYQRHHHHLLLESLWKIRDPKNRSDDRTN